MHADHLDRPLRMTNSAQSVVWDAVYNPFGDVNSITGSATNNLRFPGQYFLIEDGLHYNWYRHYDPTIGRYIQPDPLGFVSRASRYSYVPDPSGFVNGASLYSYVGSNPLQRVDPKGEQGPAPIIIMLLAVLGNEFERFEYNYHGQDLPPVPPNVPAPACTFQNPTGAPFVQNYTPVPPTPAWPEPPDLDIPLPPLAN